MTKHTLTPLMSTACEHAESVLAVAIQAVDDALEGDGCALEYPALVAGFMSVAGAAYTALTIRDAVDAFLERKEAKATREKYALAIQQ